MNVRRSYGPFVKIAIMGLSIVSSTKAAVARDSDEVRVGRCIRQVSAGRTWLEKTLWGLFDQEGGWVGAQVPNTNGTHDLGPLQVNSWWVVRIAQRTGRAPGDIRHWLTNDPCFNVSAARWIFLTALASTGDYWQAIGRYHSPSASRALHYSGSVAAKLRRRFGENIFAEIANVKSAVADK